MQRSLSIYPMHYRSEEEVMQKRVVRSLAIAVMFTLGAIAAQAEEVRVGGGGAAMSTIFDPVVAPFEKASGIYLTRRPSSPKNGLMDLVGGKLDLATAAVSLDSMIAGAAKDGVTVERSTLQQEQIGTNRTVLFVHPTNKVGKLTKAQLKGIFTGKIVNWKEVGGDDRIIIVVWGIGTPGQNALFSKEVLDGEAVTKEAMEATNYASIKDAVASTPEAIGIDPFGMTDDSVRAVASDPELSSPIIAVTIGKPAAKVQKLIDFVKGEGARYTRQ
jgi:phosphate transport system substrate-binding protein